MQSTARKPVGCFGVNLMFHRLNTCAKLVGGLIGIHGQPTLQDAWTTVEFFSHKVHCAAVPFFPCVEHSLVRVQPGVCR